MVSLFCFLSSPFYCHFYKFSARGGIRAPLRCFHSELRRISPFPFLQPGVVIFERSVVREVGLEPTCQRHTPLKRARLPIPPPAHITLKKFLLDQSRCASTNLLRASRVPPPARFIIKAFFRSNQVCVYIGTIE